MHVENTKYEEFKSTKQKGEYGQLENEEHERAELANKKSWAARRGLGREREKGGSVKVYPRTDVEKNWISY